MVQQSLLPVNEESDWRIEDISPGRDKHNRWPCTRRWPRKVRRMRKKVVITILTNSPTCSLDDCDRNKNPLSQEDQQDQGYTKDHPTDDCCKMLDNYIPGSLYGMSNNYTWGYGAFRDWYNYIKQLQMWLIWRKKTSCRWLHHNISWVQNIIIISIIWKKYIICNFQTY